MRLIRIAQWTPLAAFLAGCGGWVAEIRGWPLWPAVAAGLACAPGIIYLMFYRCDVCKQVVYTQENLKGFSRASLILKGPPLDRCLRCGAALP